MSETRLPKGSDPRLKLDRDALEAASITAMPQVARASSSGDNLTLLAGMAGIVALGLFTFFSLGRAPKATAPEPVKAVVQAPPPSSDLPPVNPSLNPVEPAPQPVAVQPVAPVPAQAETANTRAPALIIDNSLAPAQAAAQSAAVKEARALNANDQFFASQTSDASQKAQKLSDPSQVVPQGAVIPAVLETAINSDLPGYTRAIVSRDVRSFDGTQVLIPRGSRLVGQYKSGLASGETRVFIIWNRLIRPDGVSISLASPATDDLGQAGMSGKVDTHFAKRFGSAILLSIVNGLAGALGGNNSNTIVIGTSSDAQGAVGEALASDVKIPPTIKAPQGAPIQVFAARDLDFDLGQ
ncbi:MAG TPA: type IV secretion system protein VirB10 [Asticcacaulis sp.]|nr:type IV secretion system protein VirB10 [Asticcacaulis sp.]